LTECSTGASGGKRGGGARSAETVSRMHAEVRETLHPYLEGEGLAFPMAGHLPTARA